MYSVQHVLWRGAMALSLVVVGGVGANVSNQAVEKKHDDSACREDAAYVIKANKAEKLQREVRVAPRSARRTLLNACVIHFCSR